MPDMGKAGKWGEVVFSLLMFVDFTTNLLKLLLGEAEKDQLQVRGSSLPLGACFSS